MLVENDCVHSGPTEEDRRVQPHAQEQRRSASDDARRREPWSRPRGGGIGHASSHGVHSETTGDGWVCVYKHY